MDEVKNFVKKKCVKMSRLEILEAEKQAIGNNFHQANVQVDKLTKEANVKLAELNKQKQEFILAFRFVEGQIEEAKRNEEGQIEEVIRSCN